MPQPPDILAREIQEAIQPGFRGRLVARGLARGKLWVNGTLPPDSPEFSPLLSDDLIAYGMGLLDRALMLRETNQSHPLLPAAFEQAAEAIEAVIRRGDPELPERGFYTLLAAAAYHLGHFSARAYSLFVEATQNLNLSPSEVTLVQLLKRDLSSLRESITAWADNGGFDETLARQFNSLNDNLDFDEALQLLFNAVFHRALAWFDHALETGSATSHEFAIRELTEGVTAATEFKHVTFWWLFTIARHLLDDLWDQSLHVRLPGPTDDSTDAAWGSLRRFFIALVGKRKIAEIDLWPSQLAAAARALDISDDLVIALPTSAGKTRIAEICILRALSLKQRVVFVTPLRALSAQTERTLRNTFVPLGFSVSSLYGSSGVTGNDVDSLANRDIVVSTPEKLDFALRNDSGLLSNVGLVVLDEGHSIGIGDREVRYEVLIQRILRRDDASQRRIVCLSALLPTGEQLDDFVGWLRQDVEGDPIASDWRPTRRRYGEIVWEGDRARLSYRIETEMPFVPSFLVARRPLNNQRKKAFPKDGQELTLASAWQLAEEGQTVLIYCPQRRSVQPLAALAIDLNRKGYLKSLLRADHQAALTDALNVGREWLGDNHPAVQCLKLGLAIHHGQLPRPFQRAVEHLLREQILKITIASPTLSQGLNLSATSLLFHSLFRARDLIPAEEFANVAGRAGRAFVDVEGQVLCVDFKNELQRRWESLIGAAKSRDLRSGLLQLVLRLASRLQICTGLGVEKLIEYVTGNSAVWDLPTKKGGDDPEVAQAWLVELARLDSAILSLVRHDTSNAELAQTIDEALASSLWQRSLKRMDERGQRLAQALLRTRAKAIWDSSDATKRKGYFFAGVSFQTGLNLDKQAASLNKLLHDADDAFEAAEIEKAIKVLVSFARIVFEIEPFKPQELPSGWENIAASWVLGKSMADLAGGQDTEVVEFVEGALIYRLVWALEAVRVRAIATGEETKEAFNGRTAVAVETGTPNYSAALLIQCGLGSRIAAIKATHDYAANFTETRGMRRWLGSREVTTRMQDEDWPSSETAKMWKDFVASCRHESVRRWELVPLRLAASWYGEPPAGDTPVRLIHNWNREKVTISSVTFEPLGECETSIATFTDGAVTARVASDSRTVVGDYIGPKIAQD